MESVGKLLRRVRLERGLEIGSIACELRINARYLEAIEADDPKSLPGGFFSRSFYRQYASYLGICDPSFDVASSRLLADESAPLIPGQGPPREGSDLPPIPTRASRRWTNRRPLIPLALLVAAVAGCSGIYALWQRLHRATPPSEVARHAAVSPASAKPEVPARAASTTPSPAPSEVVLNLAATERTWISVTADGRVLFSGILEPSQSKTLPAPESARLLVGNAGGLDVQWRGKFIGPIGPRGQVRIVVLTPEKVEILPAKKAVSDQL